MVDVVIDYSKLPDIVKPQVETVILAEIKKENIDFEMLDKHKIKLKGLKDSKIGLKQKIQLKALEKLGIKIKVIRE